MLSAIRFGLCILGQYTPGLATVPLLILSVWYLGRQLQRAGTVGDAGS
jgi:uncharacterized membrane protein YbaN (DUF454 family)